MKITSTKDLAHVDRLKIVVYGIAGAGKTRLCATTPDHQKTVILSAEAGLLSLREFDIPVIEIDSLRTLKEAYRFLRDGDHPYDWICLDSISEIAEVCLAEEKRNNNDGRAAYGKLAEFVMATIRGFRDLPYNVYFSAKQTRIKQEGKPMIFAPKFPGQQLHEAVPYLTDEVFAMRITTDDEGRPSRYLQTQPDGYYDAKDRSGALDFHEPPSLKRIQEKIRATNAPKQEPPTEASKPSKGEADE